LRESRLTNALRTPLTFWMASVTWRAQLPQVMPVTASSVAAGAAALDGGVWFTSII